MIQPQSQNSITYTRVIHLSHVIDIDIPQWSGDPTVEFETVAELNNDGYYLRRFSLGEHSATHINAPNSFHSYAMGIDQYPAQSLVQDLRIDRKLTMCIQAYLLFKMFQNEVTSHLK
ncbi:MAG: cyclase family protein, partial [Nostoc sp.]